MGFIGVSVVFAGVGGVMVGYLLVRHLWYSCRGMTTFEVFLHKINKKNSKNTHQHRQGQ